MAKGSNPSLADIEPNAVTEAVNGISRLLDAPRVNPAHPEEVRNRIVEYFADCERTNRIPTVEGMSLALGCRRETVWRWSKACGACEETAEIIGRAKEVLAAIDAELAMRGEINVVSYVFRSKNYYGLRDSVAIETETEPRDRKMTDEEREHLLEKYKFLLLDDTEGAEK